MKGFLGAIGVFSMIGSIVSAVNWYTIDSSATTIMQQQVAVNYLVYSGILLLITMVGFGVQLIPTETEIKEIIK